eukprot:13161882-Ditylum_brightwellii.AAC.1
MVTLSATLIPDTAVLSHSIDNLTAIHASSISTASSIRKDIVYELVPKTRSMLLYATSTNGINQAHYIPGLLIIFLDMSTTIMHQMI